MTVLQILANLNKLVKYWPVVHGVIMAVTQFLAGNTVPVTITWDRHRIEITVRYIRADD